MNQNNLFITQIYPDRLDGAHLNFDSSNPPKFFMTSQHNTGYMIEMRLMEYLEANEDATWGVLIAKEGEFIVPDHKKWHEILRLTPTICLVKGRVAVVPFSSSEVTLLNYRTLQASDAYVFARDFNNAPILNRLYFVMKEVMRTTFN